MLTRLLILPITLTFLFSYCVEKININDSGDLKTTKVQSDFKKNSDLEPTKIDIDRDKIITASGTKHFTLLDTIEGIESKLCTPLKLKQSTDECYTDSSNSNLLMYAERTVDINLIIDFSSYHY